MKNWLNKNYKTLIIAAFLVPIITVAIVSISHVTTWYGISNPVTWSVYLSIGIEIAALSALAAISANMGSKIYFPFAIVTLVQFIGNIFFAYSYINIDTQQFKDWVDLVSPLVEFLGVEPTDFVGHKRFLAFFAGGMLPVISLSFLHMLVKFTEEDRKKQNEVIEQQSKPETTVQASDLVGEVSRLRLSEEDLKKLEEVLLNSPPPNEKLVDAFKRHEEHKIEEEKLKAVSLKEEWVLNDEEILKRAEEIKHRQILVKAQELKNQREEIHGPDDLEEEPTALANSEYRENIDVELVEEEVVNDTPTSIEEKTLNLRQVVFEPIEETTISTKEEQRELLSEMMRNDQELGLYDESLFPKKIIENSKIEEVLEQKLITPALSDEEVREMFMDEWERKFELVEEEDFSTIEPTEEEIQQNFSTIEPNPENFFQENTEQEFHISIQEIPTPNVKEEIIENTFPEPILTPTNPEGLVEKKNF